MALLCQPQLILPHKHELFTSLENASFLSYHIGNDFLCPYRITRSRLMLLLLTHRLFIPLSHPKPMQYCPGFWFSFRSRQFLFFHSALWLPITSVMQLHSILQTHEPSFCILCTSISFDCSFLVAECVAASVTSQQILFSVLWFLP